MSTVGVVQETVTLVNSSSNGGHGHHHNGCGNGASSSSNGITSADQVDHQQIKGSSSSTTTTTTPAVKEYKISIVWRNIILMTILHTMAVVGAYHYVATAQYKTLLYTNIITVLFGLGVTCGAHRLWSHRSYEAKLPLRIFLMILNSASLQNDILEWSRDHRVHHKFSDTDADPHNSNRGFFFAHMGWLLCRKHPEVLRKGKTVSLADIEQDPVVQFQRQFYKPLAVFCTFYLPTYIPYYFWGENFYVALYLSAFRYCFSLHSTWLVNSAAHLYGTKPYDKVINPVESKFVQVMTVGEGYHNYHHVFPFDYSASELSWTHDLNVSTLFIDLCAKLGLAYNLKKVDEKVVKSRIQRTGDNSLNEVYLETRSGKMRWISIMAIAYLFFIIPTAIYLVRLCFTSSA